MKKILVSAMIVFCFVSNACSHEVCGEWKSQTFQEFFAEMQTYGKNGNIFIQRKNVPTKFIKTSGDPETRVEWFKGKDGSVHDLQLVIYY